eukprot:scaffold7095_cov386-Prasinococcus_capsulatus_cf.AAC.5
MMMMYHKLWSTTNPLCTCARAGRRGRSVGRSVTRPARGACRSILHLHESSTRLMAGPGSGRPLPTPPSQRSRPPHSPFESPLGAKRVPPVCRGPPTDCPDLRRNDRLLLPLALCVSCRIHIPPREPPAALILARAGRAGGCWAKNAFRQFTREHGDFSRLGLTPVVATVGRSCLCWPWTRKWSTRTHE